MCFVAVRDLPSTFLAPSLTFLAPSLTFLAPSLTLPAPSLTFPAPCAASDSPADSLQRTPRSSPDSSCTQKGWMMRRWAIMWGTATKWRLRCSNAMYRPSASTASGLTTPSASFSRRSGCQGRRRKLSASWRLFRRNSMPTIQASFLWASIANRSTAVCCILPLPRLLPHRGKMRLQKHAQYTAKTASSCTMSVCLSVKLQEGLCSF